MFQFIFVIFLSTVSLILFSEFVNENLFVPLFCFCSLIVTAVLFSLDFLHMATLSFCECMTYIIIRKTEKEIKEKKRARDWY